MCFKLISFRFMGRCVSCLFKYQKIGNLNASNILSINVLLHFINAISFFELYKTSNNVCHGQ